MRPDREEFRTRQHVFDQFTNRTLFELSSHNHFSQLQSPLSTGKESNVFTAEKGKRLVIVKIYRLQTCDFRRMYEYIRYDPRFMGLENNRRKIIFAWCRREYSNLLLAEEAGLNVPHALAFQNNVLVEEFIGEKTEAARKVKDHMPEDPEDFWQQTIKQLKKLRAVGMVHGDLSAFNLLNFKEKPIFIDLSHTTQERNPRYNELWERDLHALFTFFRKLGVKIDEEAVKKEIFQK